MSVSGAILAAFGEVADIVGIGPPLGEDAIGHVENFLKLAVPRHETRRFIEHGDTIAHVLEGDAEFFLALADLIEQPGVLHRDHRLGGEVFQQRYFLLRERAHFLAVHTDVAEQIAVLAKRDKETGSHAGMIDEGARNVVVRSESRSALISGMWIRRSPSLSPCVRGPSR